MINTKIVFGNNKERSLAGAALLVPRHDLLLSLYNHLVKPSSSSSGPTACYVSDSDSDKKSHDTQSVNLLA